MTDRNLYASIRPRETPALLRQQRNTVLALVMAFVSVLLLIQLWLLVQAIEGAAKGERAIVFPVTLASRDLGLQPVLPGSMAAVAPAAE